jgi:hypothetical protein
MQTGKFLTAEWRYLAMINYEIDPGVLLPFVPRGAELDARDNRAFVSVVGFLFLNTRVLGLPIPFHRDFEEINLRFYVRRRGPEGWRRGVVFVKEIVPRWAIATVARIVYNENYVARQMSHRIDLKDGMIAPNGLVEYSWRETAMRMRMRNGERERSGAAGEGPVREAQVAHAPRSAFKRRDADGEGPVREAQVAHAPRSAFNRIRVRTVGEAQPLAAGSEEEFITEHYWGYAAQRDGGCVEYQVEHPSWRVWQTSEAGFDCDVKRVYGEQFVSFLSAVPISAFVAEGSPVVVRKGQRI